MEQITRYFHSFGVLIAGLSIFVGGDSVRAQLRVPGTMAVSTRSSTAMAASEQPQLYCGNSGGQVVGCWNKEKYDEWARNQGRAERSQSFNSSYDGQRIIVDQSQLDYQPTIPLQAGGGSQSENGSGQGGREKVNLEYQITLSDPKTNKPLVVDNRLSMGNTFAQDALKHIVAAAPAVIDFLYRQKQMQQTREHFQQQLNLAQQQSEAQINSLRQESQNTASQAQDARGLGLANLGAGLAGSNALLSPAQIQAMEKIRKLQNSDLRFSQYQMNPEAYDILDKQLAKQIKDGRWSEIPATVEALNYADVIGEKNDSKTLKKLVNSEGIIRANSYLDEKRFKTEFKSENGQIVRRITNRFQAVWKESESLKYLSSQERAQFFMGSLVLSLGDEAIAAGELVKGSGLLKMAQSVVDGLQGFSAGLSESVSDLIKSVPAVAKLAGRGIAALANDPVGSWETVVEFASNLDEVKGAIINALNHDYEKLKSGSAFEKGHVIGKYAIDIVSLVAAGGSVNAVKSVAATGELASAIQRVKFAERMVALIPEAVLTKVGGPIAKVAKTIEGMPQAMRSGLKYSAARQPEVANAIAHAYEKALVSGDSLTATYLKRVAASKQSISGSADVADIVKLHSSLSEKLKIVEKTSKEGVFSRAIAKEYKDRVTGQLVKTKITEVFNKSPTQLLNEHRFTVGGEFGHSGLYISEGPIGATRNLLSKETGKTASELWIAQQNMQINNLLDLTNPKILEVLDLKTNMLFEESYNFTQVIGDTAKSNGFKGIIFNSVKDPSKVNIVIFN